MRWNEINYYICITFYTNHNTLVKMKNTVWIFIGLMTLTACQSDKTAHRTETTASNPITYIYDDGQQKIKIEMPHAPQRAALLTPYATEMLLAMEQEQRMVLGCTTWAGIHPDYRKAFDALPYKVDDHHFNMTKEAFLLMEPDFVSGFPEDINAQNTGTPKELINKGIFPFILETVNVHNATLEDVYHDIERLGKVFRIEDKAKKLIAQQREKLANANLIIPNGQPKKAMVMFYPFSNGVWIYSSLVTDLINKAHGKNIFDDVATQYELMSYEAILDRNPDVIFIVSLKDQSPLEEKINTLKANPVLKNVEAVKNRNVHIVTLEDIYPGIRNVDFVIKMNKIFYASPQK